MTGFSGQDRTVRLGSLETGWRESGAGVRGTVLALHGLGLDRASFDPLGAALPDGWRLVSYDQRGHGEAARIIPDDLEAFVEDVLRAIAHAGGQVHLLGHSMGGAVAALAAARSDAVLSLTLIATPPRGFPEFARRGEAATQAGMDAVLAPTLSRWFGPDWEAVAPSGAVSYASTALRAMRPEGWAAAWQALASFEGFGALAVPGRPSLALAAEDDLSTPPHSMEPIAAAWEHAGARLNRQVLARGGHLLPVTQPDALAALLPAHWTAAMQ
ncbi:alpha/beta fold hydrolase [Roseomonas chloroacetimidivorans]|uniref:alpha/beta fold hydrolase n=1 Tax=Roseomonas chloroacetimidivorans TaxID=1766656 RepID=UPI003C730BDD